MFLFAAVALIVQYFALIFLRIIGQPLWWSWIAFGIALGVAIVWAMRRELQGGRWGLVKRKETLPVKTDPSRRVQVACPDRMASQFEQLSGEPFEPRVFQIHLAMPEQRKTAYWLYAVLSCVVFAMLYWVERLLGVRYTVGPVKFWAAMSFAALPLAWMWPVYLRIAPGRLDVFKYGFLGRGAPRVKKFDVRVDRVMLDVRSNTIRVVGADEKQSSIINLGMLCPQKVEIARAVIEAAISEHPTPPLPDDALVG